MLDVFEGLSADDWGGFLVPHKYMGPLPAFFFPAFQLVDYAVHLWDIREGQGQAHTLDGDAADLLVPVCFVLWQATADCGASERYAIGIRVSGRNGGDTRITVSPDGLATDPGPVDDLPCVLEFDPASFVLTAFGRMNAGTARGDAALASKFCNLFSGSSASGPVEPPFLLGEEGVGLLEPRVVYRLNPAPFMEMDTWLTRYGRFWETKFEALRDHMEAKR